MGTGSLLVTDQPIIFFDSACLLCSSSVNFILKNDKCTCQKDKHTCQKDKQTLHFAALESKTAKALLPPELVINPETVVFFEDGEIHLKSKAVFKIINYLCLPWSLLKVFKVLPVAWNDMLYDWVARNRLQWFGRSQSCYLPGAKHVNRFID